MHCLAVEVICQAHQIRWSSLCLRLQPCKVNDKYVNTIIYHWVWVISHLSESSIVFNLWAIVNTVQSLNSSRIVLWMRSSVSRSTAAVASSKMRTLVFLSRARAKQMSCLCPTLKLSPPSLTSCESPFVKAENVRISFHSFSDNFGNYRYLLKKIWNLSTP